MRLFRETWSSRPPSYNSQTVNNAFQLSRSNVAENIHENSEFFNTDAEDIEHTQTLKKIREVIKNGYQIVDGSQCISILQLEIRNSHVYI